MDYNLMREFADSWGLVAMALFFVGVIVFALRPGSRKRPTKPPGFPLEDE